jgi:hypothetical protein
VHHTTLKEPDIPFKLLYSSSFTHSTAMTDSTARGPNGSTNGASAPKKKVLLNAFDMSTVGHLSPGQWKNPKDRSATKRKLDYWIDLAKLLERGGINALFLADTYGGYDTYEGSLDNCIRRAAQWPMTDPTIVRLVRLCCRVPTLLIKRSPYQQWQQ